MTNIEDSFKFWDINFRGLKKIKVRGYGLGLCCLMPLSTIFQLYRSGHNVVSSTSRLSGVRTHNVSGDRY